MTFSQAWMTSKNPKLARTKLLDIKVQKQRAPIMMTEAELAERSQVLSFQFDEVKMPFKLARMEAKHARKMGRALFYRASTAEEYPWNKTPIMVTHLHARKSYVIPRKTKKQQLNKPKELVVYCPALRVQIAAASKPKKVGPRAPSSKAKPKMLKSP